MSDVKWIKIVTDIFDDEKILLIEQFPDADTIIVIWFKMLCLAGKQNNGGVFMIADRIAYTDEMFATVFRRPVNTVRMALKTFRDLGMIEIVNDAVTIPNWDKHQSLDRLEATREATRKRVAKCREKQKQLTESNVTPCNVTDAVTVTLRNGDREEKNRGEENRGEGEKTTTIKDSDRPNFDTVESYASSNLQHLSPTAMQELWGFVDDLGEALVRHAIDVSCDVGKRTWGYTRGILNTFAEQGIKTVGEAKAAREAHKRANNGEPSSRIVYTGESSYKPNRI